MRRAIRSAPVRRRACWRPTSSSATPTRRINDVPAATPGTGTLEVAGGFIELYGTSALEGIGTAQFDFDRRSAAASACWTYRIRPDTTSQWCALRRRQSRADGAADLSVDAVAVRDLGRSEQHHQSDRQAPSWFRAAPAATAAALGRRRLTLSAGTVTQRRRAARAVRHDQHRCAIDHPRRRQPHLDLGRRADDPLRHDAGRNRLGLPAAERDRSDIVYGTDGVARRRRSM